MVKQEGVEHQKAPFQACYWCSREGREGGEVVHVGGRRKQAQTGVLLIVCVGRWRRVLRGGRALTRRGGGVLVVKSGGGGKWWWW